MKKLFFTLLISTSTLVYSQKDANRIMVISGGGARGAWGAAVATKLFKENTYDVALGTSTGSLIAPFVLIKDSSTLRKVYRNVRQKDIFSVNPFVTRGKNKGKVKFLKLAVRSIFGKQTAGESKKLRKLIYREIDTAKYKNMISAGEFFATVVEFKSGEVAHKSSSKVLSRKKMLDWIWASSNQPVVMSLYGVQNGDKKEYWVDGGIRENVAVMKALEISVNRLLGLNGNGRSDTLMIDVVVNNTEEATLKPFKRKIIPSLFRTIDIFSYDTRANDVRIPSGVLTDPDLLKALTAHHNVEEDVEADGIIINYHYMTKSQFVQNNGFGEFPESLLFEPERMREMWRLGRYEEASITRVGPDFLSLELAKIIVSCQHESLNLTDYYQ